jgi:regulator of protease activity HflC (stomatin/prohibitin superfamily)
MQQSQLPYAPSHRAMPWDGFSTADIAFHDFALRFNAVIFFQVEDAQAAIVKVYNFMEATSQIAQTTLRAVLGQSSLDELLGARDKINAKLQSIIDSQTGVVPRAVEI